MFKNYNEASDYLGSKTRRPYPKGGHGRNYVMWLAPYRIAILLHHTSVVTYTPDYMILDKGGYNTMVTRRRINECLPKGMTLVANRGRDYIEMPEPINQLDTIRVPFHDGMRVTYDGLVL